MKKRKTNSSLYPYIGVDIAAIWDDLTYHDYLLYDPGKHLPLSVFEAQPPQGKRIMHVRFEQHSESEVTIIFQGCTWYFRSSFETANVKAMSYEREGATHRVHVLGETDVSKQENTEKVDNVFKNVLKDLVCRVHDFVILKGQVRTFVQTLRKNNLQLHFA